MYHVVVRTKNRACVFGEVVKNTMRLSQIGEIARECWEEIPQHFSNAQIDQHIIMPNHVHGIVILKKSLVGTRHAEPSQGFRTQTIQVRVQYIEPRRKQNLYQHVLANSVGSIIRSFKGAVTRECHLRKLGDFKWQRNYYEHIIRDGRDLDRIRKYILDNPADWANDDNFTP
jgi:putative transposase